MSRFSIKPSRGGKGTTSDSGSGGDYELVDGAASQAVNSPTGRNPRLIWTTARQVVWNQEKADYDANPASPATLGGQWFKAVRNICVAPLYPAPGSFYADCGQWNTLMYQITGDIDWVTNATYGAWTKILGNYMNEGVIPTAATSFGGWDPNESRIWNSMHTIMLEWLWPALTQPQREAFAAKIANDNYHGWFVYAGGSPLWYDSDQNSGQLYFPIALMRQILPGNTTNNTIYNDPLFGGITSTGAHTHTTARDSIRWYFEVGAAGGEWIESEEYNKVTYPYLAEGCEGIKTATGIDYFPEHTTWLPNFARRIMAYVTPDLDAYFQWGDEENPRVFQGFRMHSLIGTVAGLLQGTAEGRQLQQFMLDLVAEHGAVGGNSTMNPAIDIYGMWYFNPYAPTEAWKISANQNFFASGQGVLIGKSGFTDTDTSAFMHTAALWPDDNPNVSENGGNMGIDHHVDYMLDLQVYKNGEHVYTHPFGYGAANTYGEGANAMRLNGVNSPWEYKKVNTQTSNGFVRHISATCGGAISYKPYSGPPPVRWHEMTRDIIWMPGTTDTFVIFDRAHIEDDQLTDSYFDGCPNPRHMINIKHAKQEWVFNTPVDTSFGSGAYTWTTPATSQSVKLTPLLPTSITRLKFDVDTELRPESDPFSARCGWFSINDAYHGAGSTDWKLHKFFPSVMANFHTYLVVLQIGAAGTTTLKQDSGMQGVHVTTTGDDLFTLFNGNASGTLNPTVWHASHAAALDVVRYRSTGCNPIGWTASAANTRVRIAHLNPLTTWKKKIDGGAGVTITPNAGGYVEFDVASSGAHTLEITN